MTTVCPREPDLHMSSYWSLEAPADCQHLTLSASPQFIAIFHATIKVTLAKPSPPAAISLSVGQMADGSTEKGTHPKYLHCFVCISLRIIVHLKQLVGRASKTSERRIGPRNQTDRWCMSAAHYIIRGGAAASLMIVIVTNSSCQARPNLETLMCEDDLLFLFLVGALSH